MSDSEDFGFSREIPQTLSLIPFFILQLSMVVFLLRHGRKEKSFREAFYTIFVAVTLADCTAVIANRLITYAELYKLMSIMELNLSLSQFFTCLKIASTHLMYIATNFQPLCHTAIAFNRFTAIATPLQHSRIWRRRTVVILLTTSAAIALLLTAIPSVVMGIKFGTMSKREFARNEKFMLLRSYVYAWEAVASVLRAPNLIICCFVGFILNVATVAMFVLRRNSRMKQQMPKRQDVKLFVHCLFVFVIQLWLTFQHFVSATDDFGLIEEIGNPIPPWVPTWLRLPSGKWLAGNHSCNPKIPRMKEYCGTFYLLLSGYLRLSDWLTLAMVTDLIFALSGALFLLIVSGHVRNAYFRIYFKCVRRRSGRVFQVASTNGTNTQRRPTLQVAPTNGTNTLRRSTLI